MIYLDNSATTIPDKSVLESFQLASTRFFANPSSIHHLGGETEQILNRSREQIATILNVEKQEIVFTSGGTEGNNLAIKGIALKHQQRGKHIITTEIEHPSVYDTCKSLEQLGFEVTYLKVNQAGLISIEELEESMREDTILVSVMHVNNEIGSVQPMKAIGSIVKKYPKALFHVDDVQGIGKVPLNLKSNDIDLCTISGHKIHGLKGTGILYVNNRVSLFPLFHGGNQENGIRSGTENVAGAVSIARALRLITKREKDNSSHLIKLKGKLQSGLELMDKVLINTSSKKAAPHIMNISIPNIKSEVMIHMLGKKNIFISTRSACSSKRANESRILEACGYDSERANSALRISLSYDNTKEEIKVFLKALEESITELSEIM